MALRAALPKHLQSPIPLLRLAGVLISHPFGGGTFLGGRSSGRVPKASHESGDLFFGQVLPKEAKVQAFSAQQKKGVSVRGLKG